MTVTSENMVVIGGGAIGCAFVEHLATDFPKATIHFFSRKNPGALPSGVTHYEIDYNSEVSIEAGARMASDAGPLALVIVATGMLHDGNLSPEKSLKELSAEKFQRIFAANTVVPALVAKHFLPWLRREKRSVFAALSARVGSISDNHLGGWYAYRSSKAALNMVLKNAAIETARRNKQAVVVGLHPGTVDSDLSKPFQANVPEGKLFTPAYSARMLLDVMVTLTPEQSGRCFAWDGQEIAP